MRLIDINDDVYEVQDILSGVEALESLLDKGVLHEFISIPLHGLLSALQEALEKSNVTNP